MSDNPAPRAGSRPATQTTRALYRKKTHGAFEDKYKERNPSFTPRPSPSPRFGKTPAGSTSNHDRRDSRGVESQPGEVVVDGTSATAVTRANCCQSCNPEGASSAWMFDPIELPKTEATIARFGFGSEPSWHIEATLPDSPRSSPPSNSRCRYGSCRSGVSSMQIDDPGRGFSVRFAGPLDMRMNRNAVSPLPSCCYGQCRRPGHHLEENADEPQAAVLAGALADRYSQPRPRG